MGMERCGLSPEIFWRWKQELGDRLDLGVRMTLGFRARYSTPLSLNFPISKMGL